jgi:hypothetical protein
MFDSLYFDAAKTAADNAPEVTTGGFIRTDRHNRLVESIKRYRRAVNRQTNTDGAPVRDINTHGADVIRYVCVNAANMSNSDNKQRPTATVPDYSYPLDDIVGI